MIWWILGIFAAGAIGFFIGVSLASAGRGDRWVDAASEADEAEQHASDASLEPPRPGQRHETVLFDATMFAHPTWADRSP